MLTKSDVKTIEGLLKPFATKKDLEPIKKDVAFLRVDVKTIKEDVTKIRRDMLDLFNFLDKDYLNLRQRVDRIEKHLNLSALQ